jgi:KaiC domain protein
MTDDDWFESALTDDADDEESPDRPDDAGDEESPDRPDDAGDEESPDRPDDAGDEESPDRPDDADVAGGGAFFDDAGSAADGDGGDGNGGDGGDDPFGGGDGPFDGGGDEAAFGGGGDAFGGGGGEAAFGGDGGGEAAFGGGGDDGAAFGGGGGDAFGGGGGDFGMGEFGGDGATEGFDDEDFESEIDRIDLGIEGLDEMVRGGIPDSSLMAVIGSAGTGKTTFGLQFLREGLSDGERAIYITLEESRDRVLRSAEEKGWQFRTYAEEDQLAVVDMDPVEVANSLSSIRSELPRLIDRFGATRLVLDSVSLLEMMYDDRATRRNEIYTFARSLKESGVTILLTSEADEDNPYASRHGIVEYLTDAVYILQYVRPSDFRETRLAVEIQKIRDAHHSREMKPYEITDEGLSVYRQANIF